MLAERRPTGRAAWFRTATVVIGAAHLALFAVVVALRLGYPYELEWMEGGAIAHLDRVLMGRPLYVEPSLEFIPFIYPPLYFYLSALPALLLGSGFVPLRLVSIAAALGSLLLIALWVRRESGSLRWGLLAACLFAATYRTGGAWLDLARVDSLFVLLLLATLYARRRLPAGPAQVVAGLCLALAFLTKQTALLVGLPLALHALWFERRRGLWFVGSAFGTIAASWLLLDRLHDGWFSYWILLPGTHPVVHEALVTFWTRDLLRPLPVVCGLAVVFLAGQRRLRSERQALIIAVTLGMVAVAWSSRLHSAGYVNVLIPLYAWCCVLAGLGAARLLATLRVKGIWAEPVIYGLVAAQLLWLGYDPRRLVPDRADHDAGDALVRNLASVRGEVLVPFHAYLAERAGKRGYGLGNAGGDVFRSGDGPIPETLADELREAIRSQQFAVIVLDRSRIFLATDFGRICGQELHRYYVPRAEAFSREDVFWPFSGASTRPDVVLVPRRPPAE
jgi:hypothetical protein